MMKKLSSLNRRGTPANAEQHKKLVREIIELKKQLAAQESVIQKLGRQAMEDPLTGLPNRRAFDTALKAAVANYKRYNHNGSILLVDINQFKSINDSLGHAAGDAILCHVANILEIHTRNTDFVARIGGDEFCIILREANQTDALLKAAELEAAVAHTPCWHEDREIYANISIGSCSFSETAHMPSTVLEKADEAMYDNKRSTEKYSDV
jgi:diguanylate cyclase (GGDEF)-like protein